MVKKHLPHILEDYGRICIMSEFARYGKGYAMGDRERQEAREIYERISGAISWPPDT